MSEQWFEEVWNGGNEAAIDHLLAPDAIVHGLVDSKGNEIAGPDEFRIMFRQFQGALSNIHVLVEAVVTEGNLQVARCLVTAIHSGEGMGKTPLDRPVRFTGMSMARIEGGKIAEAWNNFDFATMFSQME